MRRASNRQDGVNGMMLAGGGDVPGKRRAFVYGGWISASSTSSQRLGEEKRGETTAEDL